MIHIAILGLGVVGSGTADLLTKNKELIRARTGEEINIKYILDIRDLPDSPYHDKIVNDFDIILNDPEVALVIETIGGSHPAYDFSMQALSRGKHVVTSNKEVVANFGDELLATAKDNHVSYLFEASVGGGIPVLRPLYTDLASNNITEIVGILNGTTNYILTRMKNGGVSFEQALAEAQKNGYAEANPTADIDGIDACRKICILAALATGKLVSTDSVHTEGISAIRSEDVRAAEGIGASIKLLGRAVMPHNSNSFIMVCPYIISGEHQLSHVEDVFNAVCATGDFVGEVMMFGRGAGAYPTASAVCGDVFNIIAGNCQSSERLSFEKAQDDYFCDFSYFVTKRYLSFANTDRNAASVIFGDVTFVDIEGDEVAFITDAISEKELNDKVTRLCSVGAQLCAHIRVL
jgi:homoserine dehydrogenase